MAKWSCRHQAAVCSAALLVVLVLIGLTTSTAAIWQKVQQTAAALALVRNRERDLETAVEREEAARELAEQHTAQAEPEKAQAYRVVRTVISSTTDFTDLADSLWASGQMEKAKEVYRTMFAIGEETSSLPHEGLETVSGYELALSYSPLGELLHGFGPLEEAEAIYGKGIAVYREVSGNHPELAFLFLLEAAEAQHALGSVRLEAGQPKKGETAFQHGLATLERAATDVSWATTYTLTPGPVCIRAWGTRVGRLEITGRPKKHTDKRPRF